MDHVSYSVPTWRNSNVYDILHLPRRKAGRTFEQGALDVRAFLSHVGEKVEDAWDVMAIWKCMA